MSVSIPLVSLVVALIGLALKHEKPTKPPSSIRWLVLAVLLAGSAAAAMRFAPASNVAPLLVGFGVGAALTVLASLVDLVSPPEATLLGLGACAASVLLWLPGKNVVTACLAAPVGAAIVAMILPNRSASLAALAFGAAVLAEIMGSFRHQSFTYPSAGGMILCGVALIALVGLAIDKLAPSAKKAWPVISTALAVALSYICGAKYLELPHGWSFLAFAPVVALVAFWLQDSRENNEAFLLIVVTIVWIGLATVAFGMAKGFGIALASAMGIGFLILLGSDKALVSAGPILALALHRVFREVHPDVAEAIDVGQHYALIGLALGALVPLLPEEWLERVRSAAAWRAALASGLWTLLGLTAPVLLALFLAPKGLLGFVTGLGFSGFFGAMRPQTKPVVLAFATGIGTLAVVEYGWIENLTEFTRDQKIHWFVWCAVGLLVFSGLIGLLGRSNSPSASPMAGEAA